MFASEKISCCSIDSGKPIPPHTPHAVSVSLPTISDVLAYKENVNGWIDNISSGYPRFYTHPYEQMASAYLRRQQNISKNQLLLLMPSVQCAEQVQCFTNVHLDINTYEGLTYLAIPEDSPACSKLISFVQRTGCKAYTRQLEDFLVVHKLLERVHPETVVSVEPEENIKSPISNLYQTSINNVSLYSSGMNALFSIYSALKEIGKAKGRTIFIIVGKINVYTAEILEAYSEECITIPSVDDLDKVEKLLSEKGDKVAGILTETPTNPYMRICDIPHLSRIARSHGAPLILDTTIGTPVNLDVLSYCDVAAESLTKFASGTGEVMGGVAVLNPRSPLYAELSKTIAHWGEPMYIRDAQRLAYTIKGYELRVTWARESVTKLVTFFSNHHKVKKVYWSHSAENIASYRKIERMPNSYCPVITIELNTPIEEVYNKLHLPKGPSLGTDFTLVTPYCYLTHYQQVMSEKGRTSLRAKGINPEILRISIGCEPVQQLIGIFSDALGV